MVHLSDNQVANLPSQSFTVAPIARRSAADEVRRQLVSIIKSGQLRVDDRLPSETELARQFGVSRPVIREALNSLQALGLTDSQAGRGTVVASTAPRMTVSLSLGRYESADLNEVRRCLEVPAARMAAERRSEGDLKELRRIVDLHDEAQSTAEAVESDGLFHCALARATGNLLFVRMIEDVREILQQQSMAVSALRGRGTHAGAEHRAVLKAVERGNSGAAGRAMEEHLDAVEVAIRQLATGKSEEVGDQLVARGQRLTATGGPAITGRRNSNQEDS